MQGRRLPDGAHASDMAPGDYAKWHCTNNDETEHWEQWVVCAPDGSRFVLCHEHSRDKAGRAHHVEEHEDGTISVLPQEGNSNSILSPLGWHGYMRRGVWEAL